MTYRIYLSDLSTKREVAKVASIEAARVFLAGWGEIVCFDLDEPNDAADCALVRKSGALEIYAIEPERSYVSGRLPQMLFG